MSGPPKPNLRQAATVAGGPGRGFATAPLAEAAAAGKLRSLGDLTKALAGGLPAAPDDTDLNVQKWLNDIRKTAFTAPADDGGGMAAPQELADAPRPWSPGISTGGRISAV